MTPGDAEPESLMTAPWLADRLGDPRVRPMELVRGAPSVGGVFACKGGHNPGAGTWDFQNDLRDSARRVAVDQDTIEARHSRSGITPQTIDVLCSGLNNLLAT